MWRTIGVLVVGCANVGRWVDEEMEESNVWKGIGWFMKGWAGQWMVAKPQVLVGFASLWHRTGVVCCSEKWNELDEKLEIFEKMERNFEDNRWPRQFLMLRCYEKNPVRGILVNRQAAWEFRIEYVRVAWLSHSTHYWPPALFIFLQCVFYHPPGQVSLIENRFCKLLYGQRTDSDKCSVYRDGLWGELLKRRVHLPCE